MANVFVVNNLSPTSHLCTAVLGFRNVINGAQYIGSEDPLYPFANAFDNKTNTEYSPFITSGTVIIEFSQSAPTSISYFALFCKNSGQCNLSFEYEVLNVNTGNYESVGTRSAFGNAKPQMISFDPILSSAQRLTIGFDSKCYIANIATGAAINFGRTVSQGFQVGRNASLDEVASFSTEGNNFIQGRRLFNGYQEKASLAFLNYDEVDVWWSEYMNHVLNSKPLFFMANNQKQNNVVFGLQSPNNLTKPSYKNSFDTDLEFDIQGWA